MSNHTRATFAAGLVLLVQFSCAGQKNAGYRHVAVLVDSPTNTWILDEYSTSIFPDPSNHNQQLWSVAAIVCPPHLTDAYSSTLPTAAFFLLAGPDMSDLRNGRVNLDYIRFADKCRAVKLRGNWIRFSRDEAPFFLLTYDCGGTAGDLLEIFVHEITLVDPSLPDSYQCHSFRRVFEGNSRVPPFIADANYDGTFELIIGTSETNGTAVNIATSTYQVLEWNRLEGAFQESKVVPISLLESQVSNLARI